MDVAKCRSLYEIFIEFPTIVESVQESLFLPAARSISNTERKSRTQGLVERLMAVQETLKQVSENYQWHVHPLRCLQFNRNEPERDMILLHAALIFEITLYSLLALVQYPVYDAVPYSRLPKYNEAGVEASRRAIESLVAVGRVSQAPGGWAKFLNMYLALLLPFHECWLMMNIGRSQWCRSSRSLFLPAMRFLHLREPI